MAPWDGERRFTSAITPTVCGGVVGNGRTAGAFRAARSNSSALAWRASTRARVTVRIASSVGRRGLAGDGILAFGRCSGRLWFGKSSGASMPVTRRQREILDYVSKHIDEKGY